jgi:hypothetical protein
MAYETKSLKGLAISDAGLLFDPATGCIYTTNPVGVRIIEALRKGAARGKILDTLTREFDVDRDTAERDFDEFTGQLQGHGLVKDKPGKAAKKRGPHARE